MGSAVRLHRAGRVAEAIIAYQQILASWPDLFDAQVNFGNLLAKSGRTREAITAYRSAIKIKPDAPDAHFNLGNALKTIGQLQDSVVSYRRALALRPDFPQALFNLGNSLEALGRNDEAIAAMRRAVQLAPEFVKARNNLGILLLHAEDLEGAKDCFETSVKIAPGYAPSHNNLGMVLQKLGSQAASEQAYRLAIRLRPDYREAYEQLGSLLLEMGRTSDAFAVFRSLAMRNDLVQKELAPHKLLHDIEQENWLGRPLLECDRINGGERISGSAINLSNNIAKVEARWKERPQIVVIDSLLTDEALAGLRYFCLNSVIWNDCFEEGYLGTRLQSGFGSPLLAQIADGLARTYPSVFQNHPLLFAWAFKYDQALKGTRIHADFAAVNVNFWITPDDANLDPDHGGLIVYDKAAPLDWDFSRYNTDESAIRQYIAESNAKSLRIPYRANRAVIFDSDLFHETDMMSFAPGYANRRINITLLYGTRECNKS